MQRVLNCEYWAKSFYFLSKLSLLCKEVDTNVSPLRALSMFLIEQSPTLYGHSLPENPTIQMLYRLAIEHMAIDFEERESLVRVVDVICTNNERLWHKMNSFLAGVPGMLQARNTVSRALDFNSLAKQKCLYSEDSDSTLESLLSRSRKKMTSNRLENNKDLEFIINFHKKLVGKMNWAQCLKPAHEKNLCKRFSTVESIRYFYHNSVKK